MNEVRGLWGKLLRRDTWQITPNDLERCFWEAEQDRMQAFERARRSQQLDFALAKAPWTKAEDSRHEIFQRFLLEAIKTFASHQDDRKAEFKELVDNHDKTFQETDQMRQTTFDDANATRLQMFQASQERREKYAAKFAKSQMKMYKLGRKRRQEDCKLLVEFLRDLFNKMMREEIATFKNAQRQREERVHSTPLPVEPVDMPLPIHENQSQSLSRPTSSLLLFKNQNRSPFRNLRSWGPPTRSIVPAHSPLVPSRTPSPNVAAPPSRPRPTHNSAAPAYGPHVEGLDHVQVLERTFDEREDQRQATSVRDIEMRTTFVSQVKSYLQEEQRHTQFRRLKSHIDQHVTSTQKRLKNILGALAGAYIKAELHRDRVFADSEAHMRFVFDDMMSLMESSLEP